MPGSLLKDVQYLGIALVLKKVPLGLLAREEMDLLEVRKIESSRRDLGDGGRGIRAGVGIFVIEFRLRAVIILHWCRRFRKQPDNGHGSMEIFLAFRLDPLRRLNFPSGAASRRSRKGMGPQIFMFTFS